MFPQRKFLVFTSAGDEANIHLWLEGNPIFDLHITYYGTSPGKYRELTSFYSERKGTKFPNLLDLYHTQPDFLRKYEAIMVMDDDIIISTEAINRLFEIQKQKNLWLLQPAFSHQGKVSHKITRYNPSSSLRFSNFVEMTCPLFRTDKLINFLDDFDPSVSGWGTDYWFIHSLGDNLQARIAIVDDITCINPFDDKKRFGREIDRFQATQERRRIWENLAERRSIPKKGSPQLIYSAIKHPFIKRYKNRIIHLINIAAYKLKKLAGKLD